MSTAISSTNLESLDSLPAELSQSPMDRYLSSSSEDEALPAGFEHSLGPLLDTPSESEAAESERIRYVYPRSERRATRRKVPSVFNSDHSSVGSNSSMGSYRSNDSRGTRRGRRNWSANLHGTSESKPPPQWHRYYCTWTGCHATFKHRYEWSRHEEAIHHCPYRWVCCADLASVMPLRVCLICESANDSLGHLVNVHFSACASKTLEERTFYRQGQLAQHIKRAHYEKSPYKVPESLLEKWKSDNPAFKESSLRCLICGNVSQTWTERQDHVSSHFKKRTPELKNDCMAEMLEERRRLAMRRKELELSVMKLEAKLFAKRRLDPGMDM